MKKILTIFLISGIFFGSVIAPTYTQIAFAQPAAATDKPIVDGALDEFACSFPGNLNVAGCIIRGAYYLLFLPAILLARFFGLLMDASIIFSVASTSYDNSNIFIQKGWTIVRDISNIFFIFALLVAAIGTILGLHSVNAKKTIASVIVVGLLINFSLFFAKVIVDFSHVMSRVFYSNLRDPDGNQITSVSWALMDHLEPQTILSEAKWKDAKFQDETLNYTDVATVAEEDNVATKAIITLFIAGAINWILVYLFAVLAAVFITRVLTIWLSMIFAPLAFASLMVPQLAHMQYIGFSSWLKNLTSAAFMAPIFLFFIYLIIRFANILTPVVGSSEGNWFSQVLKTIFPFVVIVGLLIAAKKVTVKMSGKMGEGVAGAAAGAAKMAAGAAAAVYTGGATMAIGGAGARLAGSSKLKGWEAAGGVKGTVGGLLRKGGSALSTNSLDWRSTAAGKGIAKSMGIEVGQATESYADRRKAFRKKKQDQMKDLEVSDDEPVMRAMQEWREKFGQELIHLDHQIEEAKADVKENNTPENQKKLADLKTERSLFKKGKKFERDSSGNVVIDPTTKKPKEVQVTDSKGNPIKTTVSLGGRDLDMSQLEDKRDHMNVERRRVFADTVQRNEILGMAIPNNVVVRAFGIRNRNRDIAADDIRRHHHTEYSKKKEKEDHGGGHGGGGHGGGDHGGGGHGGGDHGGGGEKPH